MYFRIARSVELVDPADTAAFHASCDPSLSDDDIAAVLDRENIGAPVPGDPSHLLVRVDAVRRLAAGRVGPTWDRDFESMLTYAAGKGWLSNDGTSIRAHLERC